MKRTQCALIVLGLLGLNYSSAVAQTAGDLKMDETTPGDVVTYGMGYSANRYSPLKQINAETVAKLAPVWSFDLDNDRGEQAQPLLWEGVIYITTHKDTFAIDATTGKEVWRVAANYDKEALGKVCCGITNRGAAIYNGKLYRTLMDAQVVALDAKTGKEIWRQKVADTSVGYSMNHAPLVANGVLITGIGGGEYGTRGFLDGWDLETGKKLWRLYTIPGEGETGVETWPGDTWKRGGAPTWLTGSYDPELDLVYWGTGNGGPWNANVRKGDNLYICSVLAIKPKTGEIAWHYQFTPNDPYDYDGTNEFVLTERDIDGRKTKVLMQANRNGFFYVLNRENGKLIAANKFVEDVNWAEKIDLTTGRPVESELTKKMRADNTPFELQPGALGGKNWMPMSYNPETGLVYTNTLRFGMYYAPIKPEFRPGTFYFGIDFKGFSFPKDGVRGNLRAIDPMTGETKWKNDWQIPSFSGVVSTGGGLVFTGAMTGEFKAFDAATGKELWSHKTNSGIIGQPIVWEKDGKQYITVPSGIGGVYPLFSGDERLKEVPVGGKLWTFGLAQ